MIDVSYSLTSNRIGIAETETGIASKPVKWNGRRCKEINSRQKSGRLM